MGNIKLKLVFALFIALLFLFGSLIVYYALTKTQKAPLNKARVTSQFASGVNPRVLFYLGSLPKDTLISSLITNEYRGTITRISTQSGKLGSFSYSLSLTIKAQNNIQQSFFYNDNNIAKMKVFGKTNIHLSLTDLKPGDNLDIQETIDATKDFSNNREEIIITRQ